MGWRLRGPRKNLTSCPGLVDHYKRGKDEDSEGTSHHAGTKQQIRIMVRGHWKVQHYGEGFRETKVIRIEPYYRGPEMADLVF
jgi:hypothetical protein